MHTSSTNSNAVQVWRHTYSIWLAYFVSAILIAVLFYDGIKDLLSVWEKRPEYSYGYMIPFISGFLVWQRKDLLERIDFKGSWWGIVLTLIGGGLYLLGKLSTLNVLIHYSMIVVILGLALSYLGTKAFKIVLVPLLFLVFMIPIPRFLIGELSQFLQLISSELGVWFIRLLGVSVFLEGNVIDLGVYKLQVVEACNGLRYLFPLMAIGFIAAYFFKVEFWKRAVLFLSTIPITIFMNSFRIGVIGYLVDNYGVSHAEGFLHDFEGWVVFMACTAVLMLEMYLLLKIGREKKTLADAFAIELPEKAPSNALINSRKLSAPILLSIMVVVSTIVANVALTDASMNLRARNNFASFPVEINSWSGQHDKMEQIFLDTLQLDDYLLTNYKSSEFEEIPVSFYIAYYASQTGKSTTHTPRSCLPGSGWKITSNEPINLTFGDTVVPVNKVIIKKGEYSQLVYYFFKQRERLLTNDLLVKWYVFWDAITKHRTDGALIRTTTTILPSEEIMNAQKRLDNFVSSVWPYINSYVPD